MALTLPVSKLHHRATSETGFDGAAGFHEVSDELYCVSQGRFVWDFPMVFHKSGCFALTFIHHALFFSLSLPSLVSYCQSGRREIYFPLLTLSEVTELINELLCLSGKASLIVLLWLSWQHSAFYELNSEALFGAQFRLFMVDSSCIFYVCCCYIVAIGINLWLVYLLWIYNDFTS